MSLCCVRLTEKRFAMLISGGVVGREGMGERGEGVIKNPHENMEDSFLVRGDCYYFLVM